MTIIAAGVSGGNYADSATSITLTNSHGFGNVSAGQLVVIWAMKYSPTTTDVFEIGDIGTDTGTTATIDGWQLDEQTGGDDGGGGGLFSAVYSTRVSDGGSGQLNVKIQNSASGSYLLIAGEAFNGTWDASRVEDTNSAIDQTDYATVGTTGNVTTAGAGLIAACLQVNTQEGNTITEDGAFTLVYEDGGAVHDGGSAIYRIVSSGTTDSGDWTVSGANFGLCASAVAYKESGPPPDPVPSIPIIQSVVMR